MKNTIFAQSPATVANLGSGFDVLGLALDQPGDKIGVGFNQSNKIQIREITGEHGKLSYSPKSNVCIFVVENFCKKVGYDAGLDIYIHKNVPLSSGLGSSAASSVGALMAVNALFGFPLTKEQLIPMAMQGEHFISGALHADNVAPCLMGGITLIASYDPLKIIPCPVPDDMFVVIAHPKFDLPTVEARKVLPKDIPLSIAVKQWGHIAAFVASLYDNNRDNLALYMQDFIIEPARKSLIPGFDEIKTAAIDHGAVGCSISGGGPSVFAFIFDENQATVVAKHMRDIFFKHGIDSESYISKINKNGAQINQESV